MENILDWLSNFWDEFQPIIIIALIFIGVIACIVGFSLTINYNSCQEYVAMGIPAQWHFWSGCMANHPKFGWVPVDQYFKILNINLPQ